VGRGLTLADLQLLTSNPSKLMLQRIYAGDDNDPPAWFSEAKSGNARIRPWVNNTVLVTLEAKFKRPDIMYVAVAVDGLYGDPGQLQSENSSIDNTIISTAKPEETQDFLKRATADLFPDLRIELQILSSRFSGIPGISLAHDVEFHH
jgi:hypothetical protein